MKRIALLALISVGLMPAASIEFRGLPASVNTGDTFALQVAVVPEAGDQINLFSLDLLYSSFLSPAMVTENGYFAANGVAFFAGTPGSTSTPGMVGLFGVSDLLWPGDFLPSSDPLFDVVFTASTAGVPAITLGPGSFLLNADSSTASISGVTYVPASSPAPEPSVALLGGSGIALLITLRRRKTQK